MQTDVLDKLLYTDDMKENAKAETKIQGAMDRVSQACDLHSAQKTEVVYKQSPGKPYSEPTIAVN